MAADVKMDLRIPDLWYDFYGRLLPGTAFVAMGRALLLNNTSLPSLAEAGILAGIGYLAGLILFPLVNMLSRGLYRAAEYMHGKPRGYVYTVGVALGPDTRWTIILSKLNAETAFFSNLTLFTVIFLYLAQLTDPPVVPPTWCSYVVTLVPLGLAFLVASNRVRHASAYEPIKYTEIVSMINTISELIDDSAKIAGTLQAGTPARENLQRLQSSIKTRLLDLPRDIAKLSGSDENAQNTKNGAS